MITFNVKLKDVPPDSVCYRMELTIDPNRYPELWKAMVASIDVPSNAWSADVTYSVVFQCITPLEPKR